MNPRAAFIQIIWGLLIAAIDIKLEWFDLLPDGVGYVLVFLALKQLRGASVHFDRAQTFVILAGLCWCVAFVPAYAPLAEILLILANLGVTWSILAGIAQLARERANSSLAHSADNLATFLMVVSILSALFGAMSHMQPGGIPVLVVPAVIASFVVYILAMMLIHRASDELTRT
jgi:hypothetical protein